MKGRRNGINRCRECTFVDFGFPDFAVWGFEACDQIFWIRPDDPEKMSGLSTTLSPRTFLAEISLNRGFYLRLDHRGEQVSIDAIPRSWPPDDCSLFARRRVQSFVGGPDARIVKGGSR